MIRGRSAILMLIACVLLGGTSRGSQTSIAPTEQGRSGIDAASEALATFSHFHGSPRRAAFSPFSPWRTRLKSVLEQTKPRFLDDCDLGPVILSGQLFGWRAAELLSCPTSHAPTSALLSTSVLPA